MYKIRGKYPGQPWEDIDEFDTRPEALKMLAEYRMAYGPGWRFTIKKAAAKMSRYEQLSMFTMNR